MNNNLNKLSQFYYIDLDNNGFVRTIASKDKTKPVFSPKFAGRKITDSHKSITENDARLISKQFLAAPEIKAALHLSACTVSYSEVGRFSFGYRVIYHQIARLANRILPVAGGAIYIAMNRAGEIFSVSSTLQHEKIMPWTRYNVFISKNQAIDIALAQCKRKIIFAQAKAMLIANQGQLQPVYEIRLNCNFSASNYIYTVCATTGKIISKNKKKYCFAIDKDKSVKANALLITPDANLPIIDQIYECSIKGLPNKKVLKNEYFEIFIGMFAKTVSAKGDNTYCYLPNDPEFAAVSVFESLSKQIELYLSAGLNPPKQSMYVVVDDSFVTDNAYFDPQRYEIHIGIGSGITKGGLTSKIAYDLGVVNHEFGHAAVSLQAAGGDLFGAQGGAINEAIGDVLGTLVMDYLSRIWYAKKAGRIFTGQDIQNDRRIIGKYALPPLGIRSQKNEKTMPKDISGEPHADGLIIGGALADLLVAMATKTRANLENQIKQFTKLVLAALALLPSYGVSFSDMLRAIIIADEQLFDGKNHMIIEQSFTAHGITCATSNKITCNHLIDRLAS